MNLPNHIAIIVDGNRRWAKKKGLPAIKGHHQAVYKTIEPLVYHCLKLNIPYLTFWAWSTENWKRGKKFSAMYFNLLRQSLKKSIDKYIKDGVKFNSIGNLAKIPNDLVKAIEAWQDKSKKNKKLTVTIALNYGGRDEILRAVSKILANKDPVLCKDRVFLTHNGGASVKITQEQFEKYLDTFNLPDPDLIIRTGGEQRLSGFMLWQSEYSEFYFTKTYFPDFTPEELDKALKEYSKRQRRFGK